MLSKGQKQVDKFAPAKKKDQMAQKQWQAPGIINKWKK